jgi:hypothetical protein
MNSSTMCLRRFPEGPRRVQQAGSYNRETWILVVEDDPSMRQGDAGAVGAKNSVTLARNGLEAVFPKRASYKSSTVSREQQKTVREKPGALV